jgi:hypothetical protein
MTPVQRCRDCVFMERPAPSKDGKIRYDDEGLNQLLLKVYFPDFPPSHAKLNDFIVWRENIARLVSAAISPHIRATAAQARRAALEEAHAACKQQQIDFLDPQYATHQPLSSFQERFACGECINAITDLIEKDTAK